MDLGLTQPEIAEQLGVDVATILNWELNRTRPGAAHMRMICEFLGYFPSAVPADLQGRIRAARLLLGLSQVALAVRLGVNESTVRKWEKGRKRPFERFTRLFERLIQETELLRASSDLAAERALCSELNFGLRIGSSSTSCESRRLARAVVRGAVNLGTQQEPEL